MADGTITAAKLAPGLAQETFSLFDDNAALVATVAGRPTSNFLTFHKTFAGLAAPVVVSIAYRDNNDNDTANDFMEWSRSSFNIYYELDNCIDGIGNAYIDANSPQAQPIFGMALLGFVNGVAAAGSARALYVAENYSNQNVTIQSQKSTNDDACTDIAGVAMDLVPLTLVDADLQTSSPAPFTMTQN
jgi:hypothetical protein